MADTPAQNFRKEMAYERYLASGHAVQSGVKFDHETGSEDGSPKYLRTGINMAMSDQAGLVRLLISKGIFTEEEYYEAIANSAEQEVKRYEALLSGKMGKPVKLA